jgi:chemosensory pili system protein ChpA (sensor histidine kinase/response regulator)
MSVEAERRAGDPLVLVVDDYKDTRELYADYIRMSGIEVETAADGFEGIEKAILLRPDVIVMDLSMPHLDGFDTVRVLRGHERTRQIPVLALTGAMLESEGRAREEGFSAFLRKPCLPQYLLHEVRRFLPT